MRMMVGDMVSLWDLQTTIFKRRVVFDLGNANECLLQCLKTIWAGRLASNGPLFNEGRSFYA